MRSAKSASFKRELPERIARPGIEAGRNEHQLRPNVSIAGTRRCSKACEDLRSSAEGGERTIQRRALARPGAGLLRRARSGVPRRLVRGEKEDGWIFVKGILRAVSVVDVPIDDQHPGDAVQRPVRGGPRGRRYSGCRSPFHNPATRGVPADARRKTRASPCR